MSQAGAYRFTAFMTIRDICERTGRSDKAVRRDLKRLCDSPDAIFSRSLGNRSEGELPIYTFELRMPTSPSPKDRQSDQAPFSANTPVTVTGRPWST